MELHDTVQEEGVAVASFWDKYKVSTYEEAHARAEKLDFCGGIKTSYTDKGELFNTKEEFDAIMKQTTYPLIVVPLF